MWIYYTGIELTKVSKYSFGFPRNSKESLNKISKKPMSYFYLPLAVLPLVSRPTLALGLPVLIHTNSRGSVVAARVILGVAGVTDWVTKNRGYQERHTIIE